MAEVIPAILEKEFEQIEKKIRLIEPFVSFVQIDFADGKFVPNTTFLEIDAFQNLTTSLSLEAHLMVTNPKDFIYPLVQARFKRIIAHVESQNIEDFLANCFKHDIEIGLAIDGPTSVDTLKPYLADIDFVLVMAIDAGFSGQPFREDTPAKIAQIKKEYFELPVEVDGAMDLLNAQKVISVGADRINSNSYIFKSSDIGQSIRNLRVLGG